MANDAPLTTIMRPTREYFRLPVTLFDGPDVVDPHIYDAQFAFVGVGTTPVDADWVEAAWHLEGDQWISRALISGVDGGGATVLTSSDLYDVYWRIAVAPELMVRVVGQVRVK